MDSQNKVPTINLDNTPRVPPDHQLAPKKRQIFAWLKYKHSQLTKKQKIIVAVVLVLLITLGGAGGYLLYKHFHKPLASSINTPALKKTTEPSRLTGVEVSIKLNKRPVTGVMIENSLAARPQSGLRSAGVVVEAIAEGGITRFLALYQESQPSYIGPVRSVRPYYLDYLMPFQASIAHVGGAPKALKDIKAFRVRDLDQFANPGAYWRIAERASPHNVYTKMSNLDALNKAKGYTASNFKGFLRKQEAPAPKAGRTATKINLAISSFNYGVSYTYNPARNSYLRTMGGSAHNDEKSRKRIAPKVVIAMVLSRGIDSDGQHTKYGTIGSGRAYVFQDGKVVAGVWKKTSRKSALLFLKKDGTSLALNPGQTWITFVDSSSAVSFKR